MPVSNASQAELSFDVVVVGAGTAGLAAARTAHSAGATVAVVDHGPLGTFCARLACMPSKILLQSTRALTSAARLAEFGVVAAPARLDWPTARAREKHLVSDFAGGAAKATETSKSFTLLRGGAEFVDAKTLRVDGKRVTAKRWVIATGSVPVRPPIAGMDAIAPLLMTSDDVFDLEAIPASVAVIGSGAVAVELGQFLARAGAEVHLIGKDDHLAGLPPGPVQDALSAPLARELTLHLSARVDEVKRDGAGVTVVLAGGTALRVGKVLLAAGRRPNLEALGLARIGVNVEKGVPAHDEHMRTSNPDVFVAGDAAGPPALLHTATIQGRTAGENATRDGELLTPKLDPDLKIVFSDPIVATVGLDPEAAEKKGHAVCVARRPWSDQGKARILGETEGVAQIVVDRATRKLLGCQIVGPSADLLIHLASYALHFDATVEDLLALHHYHPTLAEMFPSLAQKVVSELDGAECMRGLVAAATGMQ